MRKIITFIFFCTFLVVLSTTAFAQNKKNCVLNVATFNLRMDTPNDGENAWPNRKEMVKGLFRFHDFDICGTQEGYKHPVSYTHLDVYKRQLLSRHDCWGNMGI